ncbi:MAG: hypothetical protein A2Z14_07065 [Chloroflexi bacterium RBG_16_48_8]|nr:MAG: hypothetical protein A2Z14_07065 [Chloroflexi bacterium RBG_16_48_8]
MRSVLRIIFLITGLLSLLPLSAASADGEPQEPVVGNATCLQCHSDPSLSMSLEDGQQLSLFIDQEIFNTSIHGVQGYACVQCHRNLGEYPHPEFSASDRRDLALQLYTSCQFCHSGQYERTLDSVHDQARQEGNPDAAICTDCHGAHNTQRLTDPETRTLLPEARTHIPQTCAMCHSLIDEKYRNSVHGSALIGEGNPDVPTCIDCHGVHDIVDPTTTTFRLNSPLICSECHTDPQRMAKYSISTEVLNTYVADFHGTTITIFEKLSPDAESNKPVCFDCHGVHDIKHVEDPDKGLQVRENLLARCQECHPDASSNFSDAWLSHYIPSPEKNSLVYFVNLFYKIFIPGTLGGMALLILLDISSKVRSRRTETHKDEPRITETTEKQEVQTSGVSSGITEEDSVSPIELPSPSLTSNQEGPGETEQNSNEDDSPDTPQSESGKEVQHD